MNTVLASRTLNLRRWAPLLLFAGLLLLLLLIPHVAHATPAASGNLPWESPLKKFTDSISGPVAFGISLLGIVVCGAMLIWGGEINEFARRFIMVILVVAILVFANSILQNLFNKGALVASTSGSLASSPAALVVSNGSSTPGVRDAV